MLTEPEILDLLSDYHEGRLDRATQQAVEEGLQRYPSAQRTLSELQSTIRLVSALPRVSAPAGLTAAISRRAAERVRLSQAGRQILTAQARQARLTLVLRFLPAAAALVVGCLASLVVWRVQTSLQHGSDRSTNISSTNSSSTNSSSTNISSTNLSSPVTPAARSNSPESGSGSGPQLAWGQPEKPSTGSAPTGAVPTGAAPSDSVPTGPAGSAETDTATAPGLARQTEQGKSRQDESAKNESDNKRFKHLTEKAKTSAGLSNTPTDQEDDLSGKLKSGEELRKLQQQPTHAESGELADAKAGAEKKGKDLPGEAKARNVAKSEDFDRTGSSGKNNEVKTDGQGANATRDSAPAVAGKVEPTRDAASAAAASRNARDSSRYGGAVLVRGDPEKVYALMREALAKLESAGQIRFYNPPERRLPGQVPSLEVTTDDPTVLLQVLALLPHSPDVDSVDFVPTAEAVLALRKSQQNASPKHPGAAGHIGGGAGGGGLAAGVGSASVPAEPPAIALGPKPKPADAPGAPTGESGKPGSQQTKPTQPVAPPVKPTAVPSSRPTGPAEPTQRRNDSANSDKSANGTQNDNPDVAVADPAAPGNAVDRGGANRALAARSRSQQRELIQRQSDAVGQLLLPLFADASAEGSNAVNALLREREKLSRPSTPTNDSSSTASDAPSPTPFPSQGAGQAAPGTKPRSESQEKPTPDKAAPVAKPTEAADAGSDKRTPKPVATAKPESAAATANRPVTVRITFQNSRANVAPAQK